MKHPAFGSGIGTQRRHWPALALVLAACLLQAGCGSDKFSEPATTSGASNAKATPATPEVELSAKQLEAIKIDTVGNYLFPVDRHVPGTVSLDESTDMVQAQSALLAAAAAADVAARELARVKALGADNGIAQKESEQARADHETADASLHAARNALRALGESDAAIDRMIASGAMPASGAARWVVANVPEADIPLYRVGQTVAASVLAWPGQVFAGRIERIYTTVDPDTHRLAIRCRIDDPSDELRPGMLADVTVRVAEPVAAMAVPVDTVVRENDGTLTAWVTTDRRHFMQRIVKAGLRSNDRVQILDGLKPGERVVSSGGVFLSNMLNAPPDDD